MREGGGPPSKSRGKKTSTLREDQWRSNPQRRGRLMIEKETEVVQYVGNFADS